MKHLWFKWKVNPSVSRETLRETLGLDSVNISLDVLNMMVERAREYPDTEEGGILVGYIDEEDWDVLNGYSTSFPALHVINFISSGPRTARSASSLYSDLEFQEYEFERLRSLDPRVEHLGSWHSHHCNGLQNLSQGDLRSYYNIVESPNHSHDYYIAVVLFKIPQSRLLYDTEVYQYFKFDLISRKKGRRYFALDRSCVDVTNNPSLYSDFINPGHDLPDELRRRELIARSWFNSCSAKRVIRSDSSTLDCLVSGSPYLSRGICCVSKGVNGYSLTRRFQTGTFDIDYKYPEVTADEGILIEVRSRDPIVSGQVDIILDITIRPIELGFQLLCMVLDCLRGGRRPYKAL